mmetsp:Transcript_21477/g.32491  ORF Transcript_21477/g.32491 Transcript_21477/m.32491 type:complete len:99 (-) Transcript_21477:98-394(-)
MHSFIQNTNTIVPTDKTALALAINAWIPNFLLEANDYLKKHSRPFVGMELLICFQNNCKMYYNLYIYINTAQISPNGWRKCRDDSFPFMLANAIYILR